jgi:hypothetical protein
MTVRFSFVLSDVDAENLINIVRDDYLRTKEMAQREKDPAIADWYRKNAEYVDGIRKVMVAGSSRVEE